MTPTAPQCKSCNQPYFTQRMQDDLHYCIECMISTVAEAESDKQASIGCLRATKREVREMRAEVRETRAELREHRKNLRKLKRQLKRNRKAQLIRGYKR